jgi:two-component system CheB/CheR fusion protein
MIEDITLRRESELQIARQKEALESEVRSATVKLNRTQEELRGLTAHLFKVQEEERERVARELHDDICQRLSLLEIALEEMRSDTPGKETSKRLRSTIELTHSLNTDVRRMSHGLHPAILNDLGLSAALKAMIKEFGEHEHMPVTYLTQDLPESWPPEAATAIYRIAQEALRNVAKHAGKTHVKVVLAGIGGNLQLRVMDFGVGFDQDQESPFRGLGMISMQERARLAGGTFSVQSALGQGTTVTAEVPFDRHA